MTAIAAPAHADTDTLVVDASRPIKPVTHVASGGLYALAMKTTPNPALWPPLRRNELTRPASGVRQLGNGATAPTGDALKVASTAIAAGAQMAVRRPDYPNFPYRRVSGADWLGKVDTMLKARLAATSTVNINGWGRWNERNSTWDTAAAHDFSHASTRTYREVRSLDTVTPIVGRSIDHRDASYMPSFVTAALANNTVPDVTSWHDLLNGYADIPRARRRVPRPRGLARHFAAAHLVNEYAWTGQVDVASTELHYIAPFERADVRGPGGAFWYDSDTVNGLLYTTKPTASSWLYKW